MENATDKQEKMSRSNGQIQLCNGDGANHREGTFNTTVDGGDTQLVNRTDSEEELGEESTVAAVSATTLEDVDVRNCWVCFASEEDDTMAVWTHPCKCRGTTKWVHQACIQRWVDEKQKGNFSAQVSCPQCGTPYTIQFPAGGFIVMVLDATDKMVQRMCPIMAGGLCVGSLYWTCVTFGAVTLMQTVGRDKCHVFMKRTDPLFLLVSLPLVPVGLILGKMVRWEEPVLRVLRTTLPRIPIVRNILPAFTFVPEGPALASTLPPMSDPVSVTRTFCGGLFFPSIATFLGTAIFSGSVESQLKRTILGGITFILVKGVLKIYHKQHIYIRHCKREIMDLKEASS